MATYQPDFPYTGDQIIVTSGRVLFNAKDDSVFLFAKKSIGLSSAGTINFDSDDSCIINSPRIYLGLNATEPLVKGLRLQTYLNDLNKSLSQVGLALSKIAGVPVGSPMITVNTAGTDLYKTVQDLSTRTPQLLSKTNFTL
jgi:hypothetical protein